MRRCSKDLTCLAKRTRFSSYPPRGKACSDRYTPLATSWVTVGQEPAGDTHTQRERG